MSLSNRGKLMLTIRDFSFTYPNGKKAVDGLNIEVKPGDLYAFIGHNGAGKTTTIKCIMGILDFEAGDILIDGTSIKTDPLTCKRQTAYLPDNPDLYESLTGLQYLNFVSDLFRIPLEERKADIEKYATSFEMMGELNNYISSYSHGMRQKLALIGAFIHHPKLIVMDEPFVGLDPKASFIVKNMMKEFCANGGAIFFSTHILEVAEKLCNRLSIIKQGKLVVSGTMEEVTKDASLEDVFLELTERA